MGYPMLKTPFDLVHKTNGPVEAAYTVYEDFYYYTTGIYKYQFGGVVGGHAVKILGWGTEGGVDFWLVANSWAADWGENGYFRILRGTNECGIEHAIVAGRFLEIPIP
ncbi:hypothetical protein WR25_08867 [Diploscapter pachys]|uniref:Peptidase C1A papain C-terminal domain-containing protein n=1 Tax=Diploscapter pachys TaxID=2018661 RepID=A0A2A2JAR7_9BILA|nr:hypothetical protein WR25_08867 [Diploscapter pachys]